MSNSNKIRDDEALKYQSEKWVKGQNGNDASFVQISLIALGIIPFIGLLVVSSLADSLWEDTFILIFWFIGLRLVSLIVFLVSWIIYLIKKK